MTKKRRNILIIAFGVIAVIYILTANYFGGQRTKQEFLKFDNSKIDGLIKEVYIKYHGVGFKLDGRNEEFIFYPYTSDLNDNKIFDHFAKSGDRIIKNQNSDTLTLISNDEKYKYTFQRFENE
jgi:hypothetical protein